MILSLLYILFSISCIWFLHGIGGQNIDYLIRKYIYKWDKILIKDNTNYISTGSMSQANLFNVEYINNLDKFYNDNWLESKSGFDILIHNFSITQKYESYTYFPSLVQHIGRASSSKRKNKGKKCSVEHMKQSLTFIESTFC